jgi:hypothetical protein
MKRINVLTDANNGQRETPAIDLFDSRLRCALKLVERVVFSCAPRTKKQPLKQSLVFCQGIFKGSQIPQKFLKFNFYLTGSRQIKIETHASFGGTHLRVSNPPTMPQNGHRVRMCCGAKRSFGSQSEAGSLFVSRSIQAETVAGDFSSSHNVR